MGRTSQQDGRHGLFQNDEGQRSWWQRPQARRLEDDNGRTNTNQDMLDGAPEPNSAAAPDEGVEENPKSYKICSVLGGLDVTRFLSFRTRNMFGDVISDVELVREFVSEAMANYKVVGEGFEDSCDDGEKEDPIRLSMRAFRFNSGSKGMPNLSDLNSTIQWEARGLPPNSTTVSAGLGYTDDRSDRSIEKFVIFINDPLVGDKESDLTIANFAGLILPWVFDRKSNEAVWWTMHQNGRSEGGQKEPPPFESMYIGAWIGTYGEAWAYYPPLNKAFGMDPFVLADTFEQDFDTHYLPWIEPNLPENDPDQKRDAKFTAPYADHAQAGASIITATAPIYYTGWFAGYEYNETYVASTGLDIAVSSVSSLLDIIKDRLTEGSFGLLVDIDFNTIAISQSVVELIYPERTGFEEDRVTYSDTDGVTILEDRRNVTYTVPDTIVEPLVALENADWANLQEFVKDIPRGGRDFTTLNVTITGDHNPVGYYVMVERWEYVADWVLLALAPVEEVMNAISCDIHPLVKMQEDSEENLNVESGRHRSSINAPLMSDSFQTASTLSDFDTMDQSIPSLRKKTTEKNDLLSLTGERGKTLIGEAIFINDGRLDVAVVPESTPEWLQFINVMNATGGLHVGESESSNKPTIAGVQMISIPAGSSLPIVFTVDTSNLAFGTTSLQITFRVHDDDYPDCFYDQLALLPVAVNVHPRDCVTVTGDRLRVADAKTGECVCSAGSVEVWGGRCASSGVVAACVLVPFLIICLGLVYSYVERNRRISDSVWEVNPDDLIYSDPPEILGRGTFGLVLLGEYRGTRVAVKRVIPPRKQTLDASAKTISTDSSMLRILSLITDKIIGQLPRNDEESESQMLFDETDLSDIEMDESKEEKNDVEKNDVKNLEFQLGRQKRRASIHGNTGMRSGGLSEYGSMSFRGTTSTISVSAGTALQSKKTYDQLKADFIEEMRHLSKLRHPCITTVMGAVISRAKEPLLVMEFMSFGSAYDLLHNQSMIFEGDLVLTILRDIAQGMRFLHSSTPLVIHGDLKAANVLVDSNFRAKVADFGLSVKKSVGASGTPYWMAPELLRGESVNTTASDVYSFGIILYELYSREDPYAGENFRDVLRQVCDSKINKRPPVPPSMPSEVASLLMQDSLAADPSSRPSFVELDLFLKRFSADNVDPVQAGQNIVQAKMNTQIVDDIFPEHIAMALREGRKVEPEHKDCVTVFFSDICSFTDMSAQMPPAKVNDMLDRLFFKMDHLSIKYGVFKIETIGDAWVGAANLDDSQPDHTKRVAEFAIECIAAANETLIDEEHPEKGTVQIRIGFHSGPIVAGVVGTRLPKYTLFGDVMNTGSRMESNSLPGRIHCSDVSADLLMEQGYDGIRLIDRGFISIKGKGEMHTYFVERQE